MDKKELHGREEVQLLESEIRTLLRRMYRMVREGGQVEVVIDQQAGDEADDGSGEEGEGGEDGAGKGYLVAALLSADEGEAAVERSG
jgi:hypothetical protein